MPYVSASTWLTTLAQRNRDVGVMFPDIPHLSAEEQRWVGMRAKPNVDYEPTVTDVLRDPLAGSERRMPWEAPMHDAGSGGAHFVPARLNHSYDFWETVVLRDHPQKAQLLSYLKDGVSVFEFLTEPYRGTSRESPYRTDAFPGTSLPNRIPPAHAEFVRTEVAARS